MLVASLTCNGSTAMVLTLAEPHYGDDDDEWYTVTPVTRSM